MLTLVVYAVVAVLVVAMLFGLSVAFLPRGEEISPPVRDRPVWQLPDSPLSGDDVAGARLPVGWRGYRFEETDLLLDRLAAELRARDARIAELESAAAGGADWNSRPASEHRADCKPTPASEHSAEWNSRPASEHDADRRSGSAGGLGAGTRAPDGTWTPPADE